MLLSARNATAPRPAIMPTRIEINHKPGALSGRVFIDPESFGCTVLFGTCQSTFLNWSSLLELEQFSFVSIARRS
jgi:hypothetical protein